MEPLSDFEIAKQRIEERQGKQRLAFIWLAFFLVFIVVSVLVGSSAYILTIPLAGVAALLVAGQGVELYYMGHPPLTAVVEQELEWLFDKDWQNLTGSHEYNFALGRIHKRRMGRWSFVSHMLVFLAITGFYLLSLIPIFAFYGNAETFWLFAVPGVWLVLLLGHARTAFPTKEMLSRQERAAALAMERELLAIQPHKLKRDEKLKPGARYVISDDGELVEVPDSEDQIGTAKREDIG